MEKMIKPALIGTAIGVVVAALISAAGTMAGAAAQDQPAAQLIEAVNALFPQEQRGELLKLGDAQFEVRAAPGVSLIPIATSSVRKIGYGQSRYVSISTTSSGVYSSDGLMSPHVRYPGLEVLPAPAGAVTDSAAYNVDTLVAWAPRHGWVPTPTVSAGSFAIITREGDLTVLTTPTGTCVIGPSIALC